MADVSHLTPADGRVCVRSLQRQLATMSRNLTAKLDMIQSDRYMETSAQLKVIRAQLRELTDSVINCQSEVSGGVRSGQVIWRSA